jgi:hypothetical protein
MDVCPTRMLVDLTAPESLPLARFASKESPDVAHAIVAVLAPTHTGLLEALTNHGLAGRLDG